MAEGVHASVGAIAKMEEACARFARVILERLPDIESELRRVTEALEERSDDLRSEIARLRDELRTADEDDDTSWEASRLEEAEEEFASVQRRRRKLADAAAAYAIQARKADHLATAQNIKAKEFLRDAQEDLRAYFAKTTDGTGSIASTGAVADAVELGAALTNAEKQSLRKYTGSEFERINTALGKGIADDVALSRAELISQALSKLPSYRGTTYQGTNRTEEQLIEYEPGNLVTHKRFTSSSPSLSIAQDFVGNVLFTIDSKNGKPIAEFSEFLREDEVLFDNGTQFRVLSRELVDGIWQIKLEET